MSEYEVTVTVREHWIVAVTASSPAEAREKVLRGDYTLPTPCSDREFTGLRVRKAEEPQP